MSKEISDLMSLQGEVRISFMQMGVDAENALDLAGEALHLFVQSPACGPEHRQAYESVCLTASKDSKE